MKKHVFKIVSGFIVIAMTLSLYSGVSVFAASTYTSKGFTYSVSGNSAIITGYTGTDTSLNIPAKIDNYEVTEIRYAAFAGNTNIKSVTIPNSVHAISSGSPMIGDTGCFENCTALENVNFIAGEKNVRIYGNAFKGCNSLTSIEIPGNYYEIGYYAFSNCDNLENVTYKESIIGNSQYIDKGAFNNCKNLKSVTLSPNLKLIGTYSFADCASLKQVKLFEGLEQINMGAFAGCTALESIIIPGTVYEIGNEHDAWHEEFAATGAFQYCSALKSVTINKGVEDILLRMNTFAVCPNLDNVKIYKDYELYNDAFYKSSKSIVLPLKEHDVGDKISPNLDYAKSLTDSALFTWERDGVTVGHNKEYEITDADIGKTLKLVVTDSEIIKVDVYIPLQDVENARAKNRSATSLTLTWDAQSAVDGYNVYMYDAIDGYKFYKTVSSNSIQITGLVNCRSYSFKVESYKGSSVSNMSDAISAYTMPGKATISSISNVSKGVKIEWNKIKNAQGYYIYRSVSGDDYKKIATVGNVSSYTDKSVSSNKKYKYTIRVYRESDKGDYDVKGKTIRFLKSPSISVKSKSYNSVAISWKKITGAKKYIIYRKTSNGDYKKIATTTKLAYTNKKLSCGTSYKYKIAAINGSYTSAFSSVKTVVPKPSAPTVKLKSGTKKVTITCAKISGASGYEIYRSTKKSKGYKKIKTIKKTRVNYTNSKLKSNKSYYFKVRAYKTIKGKKVFSSFSKVKRIKTK